MADQRIDVAQATRRRVRREFVGASRTKQQFKDVTDVNLIVKEHTRTGQLTHLNPRKPMYGDFSLANDLKTAFDEVHAAHDAFMELPSEVRKAAKNDPVEMLELLATEEGTQTLVDAGLAVEGMEKTPPAPLPSEPEPPGKPAQPAAAAAISGSSDDAGASDSSGST